MTTTWSKPAGSLDRWPDDYELGRPGWPSPSSTSPACRRPRASSTWVRAPASSRGCSSERSDAAWSRSNRPRRCGGRSRASARKRRCSPEPHRKIPLDDASVDAVFAAEAFHWFDDDRALIEITRVLRPRGALLLMWNLPAGPWEPSIAAVERLLTERGPKPGEASYDPLDLGGPRYVSGEWRLAFAESSFEPFEEARLPNPQSLDRDGLVAFFASMGWLADLPDEDRLPLLHEVKSLLAAVEYRRLWETHLYRTRLV